ncbi:MAG: hypothetical protein QOE64_978, partial [Frankiales bacterium]|nr:hypothetical protein [Frankiales bacterium]
SDNLFVVSQDGFLYKFSSAGSVSPSTRVNPTPFSGLPGGIAFDPAGRLFIARRNAGDIVQVDPANGVILKTVAKQLRCPLGLASEATGDLLVSYGSCRDGVTRIVNPTSASPSREEVAPGSGDVDGVAVGPDGSIYLVSDRHKVLRKSAGTPIATLADLPFADGIAVANQRKLPFLVVARNDGIITRVNLGTPVTTTDLLTGGSRGDFLAVDSKGCVYPDQSDRVLKLTNPDGKCSTSSGAGSNSGSGGDGLGDGLFPSTPPENPVGLPPNKSCIDTREFKFRLHHAPHARVVRVDTFVNRKFKQRVRGHALKTFTIRRLPKKKFTLRIVAWQNTGSRLVSTRTYRGCKKGKPTTRAHHHRHHH